MSTQIVALLFMVASFSLLIGWVFWPSNRERLEAQGSLPLDQDQQQGEVS